jgi:DNA (cytosine-5)-methyltransferase 1
VGARRTRTSGLGLAVADLFCGAGGLSEGFRAAGYNAVYALDYDRDSCETYALNHPDTRVEYENVLNLAPAALARRIGDVDVIVGGPSCQGFSTHGRLNGWHDPRDERNKLWRHIAHIVREVRPKAFLLENVPGLAYYKRNQLGQTIIRRFERLGYQVHCEILLAANYGVPQLRRRMFVIGVREDYDFEFPAPTHFGGWRRDTLEKWERERQSRGLPVQLTCWDALGDLPRLSSGLGWDRRAYENNGSLAPYAAAMRRGSSDLRDHEVGPLWDRYASLIRHVPRGGTWRDIPPHLLPDRYRGMRRTDSTNLLGRLDPNRPAYTITTQYGNVTGGCFIHPFEDRALSVREGARLQSFPDRYQFVGSLKSRCRLIGNAVPPLLAQHLACAIATSINSGRAQPRAPKVLKSMRDGQLDSPTPITRKRMTRQRRHDTGPELLLRKAVAAHSLRYRVNRRPVPELRREADIVFPTERVAVFVDGCFWHGCPKHARPTKSNTKWWAEKIEANKRRDKETTAALKRASWRVVRVWEHEDPDVAGRRVARVVRKRQ